MLISGESSFNFHVRRIPMKPFRRQWVRLAAALASIVDFDKNAAYV